jgi:hypothetical protein
MTRLFGARLGGRRRSDRRDRGRFWTCDDRIRDIAPVDSLQTGAPARDQGNDGCLLDDCGEAPQESITRCEHETRANDRRGAALAGPPAHNDDRADWREAWTLFPGEVAYVWHAALHAGTVADSLIACGFEIRAQIIWAKDRLVMGRGHYHWQHEPAWYAVRGTGHWAGGRNQPTLWQIASRAQDADTVHGAQKPVACMLRPIENNSSPGQAVYEPFAGSGTAIIAAETCGRACHAIELNPFYVDVAVRRWQAFTGEAATLDATECSFDEVAAQRIKN